VGAPRERASDELAWVEPSGSPGLVQQPVLFRWTGVPGADAYRLRVGTSPGSDDLLNVQGIPGDATRYRVVELPSLVPLYARVSVHRNGEWQQANARFTAARVAAEWLYPRPGSPDVALGRAFEWTWVPGATAFRVVIGTAPDLTDVLDQTVTGTQLLVGRLPTGRRLMARLSTQVRGHWYTRDSDFAVELGHRAPEPVHPLPGATTDPQRPFEWAPVPLASGYRLRIESRDGGAPLYDTGLVRVARTFVPELPAGRMLLATLTTVYADRSVERSYNFQASRGEPDERGYVAAALTSTARLRALGAPAGAWPRTLLAEVTREHHMRGPGCVEFAVALLRVLEQQHNALHARLLNTCLLGNYYDCHTLVELQLPGSGRWMLLDPTFAVTARLPDGRWASAADVSDAVRHQDWTRIRFVPLARDSMDWLRDYYIDYPLLFVSPFGEKRPRADRGPSILRYYERVALPVSEPGAYAVRCGPSNRAELVIDGRPTTVDCSGPDRLSAIRLASSIDGSSRARLEVYRPRRYVFTPPAQATRTSRALSTQ